MIIKLYVKLNFTKFVKSFNEVVFLDKFFLKDQIAPPLLPADFRETDEFRNSMSRYHSRNIQIDPYKSLDISFFLLVGESSSLIFSKMAALYDPCEFFFQFNI